MRSLSGKLSAALISVILGLLTAEGLLQLFWKSDFRELQVGLSVEGVGRTIEIGGIDYVTNELGLRDREFDAAADSETLVIALGDSFVFGYGSPYADLVSTRLEERLRAEVGPARVLNAGHGGFNTLDEFNELLRLTPLVNPDGVLVFFFTNDVLSRDDSGRSTSKRQKMKEYLRHHSRLAALAYSFWKSRLGSVFGVPDFMLPSDYFDFGDGNQGWVEFKSAARDIGAFSEDRGIELMFVLIPTLTNLDDRYPYRELRSAVREYLSSEAIEVVDLFGVFAGTPPNELWVSRDNTHWNGKATSMAADFLVEVLKQSWAQLWRPGGYGGIQ